MALRASKGTGGNPADSKAEKIKAVENMRQSWFAQRDSAMQKDASRSAVPRPQGVSRPASGSATPSSWTVPAPAPAASLPRSAPSGEDTGYWASTSITPSYVPRAAAPAVSDDVLTTLTERITQRLKIDLAEELRKETVLEAEKKEELRQRLFSYLQSELQTHSCPMCAELMTSPRVPMMLFPCGHTFCSMCLDKHRPMTNTCPYCCTPISSITVNHTQRQLIDMFVAKRHQYETGQLSQLCADSSLSASAIATGQHLGRVPSRGSLASSGERMLATPPVYRPPTTTGIPAPPMDTSVAPEHMDQAIKYLHDLRAFSMRLKIMEHEVGVTSQKVQSCDDKLASTVTVVSHLRAEQAEIARKQELLRLEAELVESHLRDQEAKQKEVTAEKATLQSSLELVSQTVAGLKRDIEKSRLFVSNFAPQLLTPEDMSA